MTDLGSEVMIPNDGVLYDGFLMQKVGEMVVMWEMIVEEDMLHEK